LDTARRKSLHVNIEAISGFSFDGHQIGKTQIRKDKVSWLL